MQLMENLSKSSIVGETAATGKFPKALTGLLSSS